MVIEAGPAPSRLQLRHVARDAGSSEQQSYSVDDATFDRWLTGLPACRREWRRFGFREVPEE